MRDIKNIVVHCTATKPTASVYSIQTYWKKVLGWRNPGYHWLIKPNGNAVQLLPIEQISNGVAGHNKDSIHISYIGGIDEKGRAKDTRTDKQKETLYELVLQYKRMFPSARVLGHRDFPGVTKECPSFDVRQWCECVGIPHSSPYLPNI